MFLTYYILVKCLKKARIKAIYLLAQGETWPARFCHVTNMGGTFGDSSKSQSHLAKTEICFETLYNK